MLKRNSSRLLLIALVLLFLPACVDRCDSQEGLPELEVYGELGAPLSHISDADRDDFDRGREVMEHRFVESEGLGPQFNAESCVSCHQRPAIGGGGPRYRNFYLVRQVLPTGAQVDIFESIVLPLYSTQRQWPMPVPAAADIVVQRNAPPMFGTGLLEAIPDENILSNEDPADENGDGISGRANSLEDGIGRLGFKSQSATLEGFNRGALINQMGITSNSVESLTYAGHTTVVQHISNALIPKVYAQAAAGNRAMTDTDGFPDPEISDADLSALLTFNRFLGVPRAKGNLTSAESQRGAAIFESIGCKACHVKTQCSQEYCFDPYSDLLLHNMGEELADGIQMGEAEGDEFRTQPLWGVAWSAPFLHDGRADTLDEAIRWHGGEAGVSKDSYLNLSEDEKDDLLRFLESL